MKRRLIKSGPESASARWVERLRRIYDKALSIKERVAGKPSVAFTSGGGSSNSALLSLERMISSFRLEKVADGVVSQGEPNEENLKACKKLGEALAKRALERAKSRKTKTRKI